MPVLKPKTSSILIGILALAWVFGLTAAYYVFHKPFGAGLVLAVGQAGFRILCAGIIVITSGGLGRLAAPFENLPAITRTSLQAGLGLGIAAVVILIAGAAGMLTTWAAWLVTLALAGVNYRYITAWMKDAAAGFLELKPGNRIENLAMIYCAVILGAGLITALAPPVKFDALVYHLALPVEYLNNGKITAIAHNQFSGMPQTGEMLYTWAGLLGGIRAAPVLGWMIALTAVLGLTGYTGSQFSRRTGWLAAVLLLSGYSLAASTAEAYIDWISLLFGLGVLACLSTFRQASNKRLVILAGVFAGLAWSCKYTAGMLIPIGGVCIAWIGLSQKRIWFRPALLFAGSAVLVMAPWFIKNSLLTGNPVFPLSMPGVTAAGSQLLQDVPPFGNLLDMLFLPVRATVLGIEGGAGYDFSAGPLLAGLGFLAWIGWRQRKPDEQYVLKLALIFSAAGLIIWAAANQFSGYLIVTRMYMPVFPAFTLLAAAGIEILSNLTGGGIRWGRLISAVVIFVLGMNAFEIVNTLLKIGAVEVLTGLKSDSEFLENNLGWNARVSEVVNNLPEGSRAQLVFEPRSLYCLPVCLPDVTLQANEALYPRGSSLAEELKNRGITHLVYHRAGADFFRTANDPNHTPESISSFEDGLVELQVLEDFGGIYRLYQVP